MDRRVFPISSVSFTTNHSIASGLQDAALQALSRTSRPLLLTSRTEEYRTAVMGTRVLTGAATGAKVAKVWFWESDAGAAVGAISPQCIKLALQPHLTRLCNPPFVSGLADAYEH
ncbi:hypothetical protein OG729_00795 [Streptomyces sp. NBC_00210]|uniref:hypothetical protein n=1 Tax=Streptomyces sp. NBC_00210 TaxID=2903636 RepID=UPI0032535794